jgi:hypothetical protein
VILLVFLVEGCAARVPVFVAGTEVMRLKMRLG